MGKLLSFGTNIKYPITINKLLKKPGDEIKKQEVILQFTFSWMQKVGDPFGEEWEEKQVTIADWDSPTDGTIRFWKVHEGMVIRKNISFVEIDEACPHSVQFAGLCGICGKDMTQMSWASASDDTGRAKINMIHDQTALTVSEDEASKAEEHLQRRLLQNRKLSLVVDLDQTIIHACIEPTVGEWQSDSTSSNYEAVKDVQSFQLNDDGPRGLASGCWYYIKMRPGLKEFLDKVSEMYELHVYTMGTRAYAMNIAKIVDPDKRLFGDRIISRDENGSITTKSLSRLFPVSTKMVVIIDDRADVWPNNRPNLIKVVPYDFFLGIGDINSSFLPKREDLLKVTQAPLKIQSTPRPESEKVPKPETQQTDGELTAEATYTDIDLVKSDKEQQDRGAEVGAIENSSKPVDVDDETLRLEQAAEQEKSLEKQIIERPLLHMQEKLDNEEGEEEGTVTEEGLNGDTQESQHHKHNLLKDDDVELYHLKKNLMRLHKAFYDEYENTIVNGSGRRVAPLKHALNKKSCSRDEAAKLKVVPDVGVIMPRLKAQTLAGCTIVTSGLVPLHADVKRTEIGMQAASFGAKIMPKVTRTITHLVASTNQTRTNKVRQAAKYPHIKIVNQQWLLNSISKWGKEDEDSYLLHGYEFDRHAEGTFHNNTSAPSSADPSDDSSNDSPSGDEFEENFPASQEVIIDEENVMPGEIEEGHSPIDDLQDFNWGEVDDELEDFLGDSENDSESSDSSDKSSDDKPDRKRKHGESVTAGGESEEESTLAKKQRIASERKTGLNTVKTPTNQASLPTPRDEEEEEPNEMPMTENDGDGEDDADLEALLEAEFANQEADDDVDRT